MDGDVQVQPYECVLDGSRCIGCVYEQAGGWIYTVGKACLLDDIVVVLDGRGGERGGGGVKEEIQEGKAGYFCRFGIKKRDCSRRYKKILDLYAELEHTAYIAGGQNENADG